MVTPPPIPPNPFLEPTFDRLAHAAGAVRVQNVAKRGVEWLWPGRVPIGKVTLLAGDPGLGKSLVALDIAARVSTGKPWPDDTRAEGGGRRAEGKRTPVESEKGGTPGASSDNAEPTIFPPPSAFRPPPSSVLLLSAEDDLADTIRPRLEAAGADCSRIIAIPSLLGSDPLTSTSREHELQRDLARLRGLVNTLGDCRLLIVDPISAYLNGGENSSAGVRDLLVPLAQLAQERQLAVVAVSHLRKQVGAAIYRTMGSLAFITTARAAWIISRDPQDPERRLMLPMKNNLAASATGLAYTVESSGAASAPIVRWSADPIAISVDMAIGRPAKQMGRPDEERQKAIDWLRQTLAGKGLPSKDIIERAEELGFCERTVRRAFRDSGGEAIREGFGILGVWFWKLPPPMAKNASMAKSP